MKTFKLLLPAEKPLRKHDRVCAVTEAHGALSFCFVGGVGSCVTNSMLRLTLLKSSVVGSGFLQPLSASSSRTASVLTAHSQARFYSPSLRVATVPASSAHGLNTSCSPTQNERTNCFCFLLVFHGCFAGAVQPQHHTWNNHAARYGFFFFFFCQIKCLWLSPTVSEYYTHSREAGPLN